MISTVSQHQYAKLRKIKSVCYQKVNISSRLWDFASMKSWSSTGWNILSKKLEIQREDKRLIHFCNKILSSGNLKLLLPLSSWQIFITGKAAEIMSGYGRQNKKITLYLTWVCVCVFLDHPFSVQWQRKLTQATNLILISLGSFIFYKTMNMMEEKEGEKMIPLMRFTCWFSRKWLAID